MKDANIRKETGVEPPVPSLWPIEKLVVRPPFDALFPIRSETLAAITESIGQKGYDPGRPLDVWAVDDGPPVVVDGHTRLQAARAAGEKVVPIIRRLFVDEEEALDYAVRSQRDRRNLSDADLLACITTLDARRTAGRPAKGKEKLAPDGANKSSESTAEKLGVSARKVERVRTVADHGSEETKQAVAEGKKSINRAYREATAEKKAGRELGTAPAASPGGKPKADKPRFNETNDRIEWARWTWNPLTGCRHGCPYCYARAIARRYGESFEPRWHPNRLAAPANMGAPKSTAAGRANVFVCSMADLFGDWVPPEQIEAVLAAVRAAPRWRFIFLTKNPARLVGLDWPPNAVVGATVDTQARVEPTVRAFRALAERGRRPTTTFVSFEPLLERIDFPARSPGDGYVTMETDLDLFDWVILGGRSAVEGLPEYQPEWEWVERLLGQAREAGCAVYFKPNLTVRPREYPPALRAEPKEREEKG